MNVRALSTLVVLDVVAHGRSLADALPFYANKLEDPRDKALLQAIAFGVCRWFHRLEAIAKTLLDKPIKNNDQDIYILILVGIYQLMMMRVSDYAVVNETVNATKFFKKIWAKNLVNAILREYQRRANEFVFKNESLYSHPSWLIGKIKKSWPDCYENILMANNEHPPFSLRVNQQKISRENFLTKLEEASVIAETQSGIIAKASQVETLPGFAEGEVSVQDGAAQLAAELLDLKPAFRVLDACAAPGGKAAHLLEIEPRIALTAIDCDADRLIAVSENFTRLQLQGNIVCADVGDLASWWDGKPFDRILLDAPCTATGVIRRHPDIKLLRNFEDIARVCAKQQRLLNAIWETLAPGGILLYATCSIFPEENFLMLKSFLEKHPDAVEEKIQAEWGRACEIGRQILPGEHNMDGFYYGRLKKSIK